MTAPLGRGEARALPARTLPRALGDLVRVVVARGDRGHDGENVSCATLSTCSMYTGESMMSGAAAKIHRHHDGANEPRAAAAAAARPESQRGAREPRVEARSTIYLYTRMCQ